MGSTSKILTSAIDIDLTDAKISSGQQNVLEDWNRDMPQIRINGLDVHEFAKNYLARSGPDQKPKYYFRDEEHLGNFFLQLVPSSLSDQKKIDAVRFLNHIFHQGGLLHPVTSSFSILAHDRLPEFAPSASEKDMSRKVNIIVTRNGFRLQEQYTALRMLPTINTIDEYENGLGPDLGASYVVQAQATLDVDFTSKSEHPKITLQSNTIQFGSRFAQSKLDTRSFGQAILDFLKNLIGRNVLDLSNAATLESASNEESSLNMKCN